MEAGEGRDAPSSLTPQEQRYKGEDRALEDQREPRDLTEECSQYSEALTVGQGDVLELWCDGERCVAWRAALELVRRVYELCAITSSAIEIADREGSGARSCTARSRLPPSSTTSVLPSARKAVRSVRVGSAS